FNIAQCHDRLRHDEEALAAFHRFADEVPPSADRNSALARIAVLERALAHRRPPPPPAESTPAPAAPVANGDDDTGPGAAPWFVMAGSGAVAIAGIVAVALGSSDNASVENARSGADWKDYEAAYDRGPVLEDVGI